MKEKIRNLIRLDDLLFNGEAIHLWKIHYLKHSRVYCIQPFYYVGVVSQSIFGLKN